MLLVGTRLVTVCPIAISEDCEWPAGTSAEIVAANEHEASKFGNCAYEVESGGVVGSFAEIDLVGEHAWFRIAEAASA